MTESGFGSFVKKLGNVILLLLILVILVPGVYIGFRMVRGIFFPKVDKTAISTVNPETGEREYLTLGRFARIQGTQLLVASLGAGRTARDFYASGYDSFNLNTRNYLFFDVQTKKAHWLRDDNSALFLSTRELVKDIDALKAGSERDWSNNRERFRDEKAEITGIVYEAVLSDTDGNRRLTEQDKKAILFLSLGSQQLRTIVPSVDSVLGVEQTSAHETLIFYTDERKHSVLGINTPTGEPGQKSELVSVASAS